MQTRIRGATSDASTREVAAHTSIFRHPSLVHESSEYLQGGSLGPYSLVSTFIVCVICRVEVQLVTKFERRHVHVYSFVAVELFRLARVQAVAGGKAVSHLSVELSQLRDCGASSRCRGSAHCGECVAATLPRVQPV